MHIPKNDVIRWLAVVVWLGGIVAGFAAWERYDVHAGEIGHSYETDADQPASGRWSLKIYAHPHCPCMRATLSELREILAQTSAEIDVRVVLVRPKNTPTGWERGLVYDLATAIPGVRVEYDQNGTEATHAGANVSGHVMLYDPNGRLEFRGGITRARGRVGDNIGRRAVLSLLRGESKCDREALVFGCPLFSTGSLCDEGKNTCPCPR